MLIKHRANMTGAFLEIVHAAQNAARSIPPAFPLTATVAVNPFLGQAGEDLATTAARLGRTGGVAVMMPRKWYAEKIARGEITDADLAAALAANGQAQDVAALKRELAEPHDLPVALPTVADLAAKVSRIDWPAVVGERIGTWAAGHFDQGQALWPGTQGRGAYDAWRLFATHDLSPEIAGLAGFASFVSDAPDDSLAALAYAADLLGVTAPMAETYFHALLLTMGGWSQIGRWRQWEAELGEGTDDTVLDLLTIRLMWEAALSRQYGARIAPAWQEACRAHAAPVVPSRAQATDAILQEAAERSGQRLLAQQLASPVGRAPESRPTIQAAFCIDVRSELFRRALETVDSSIQTIGFAGFFGLPLQHRLAGSTLVEPHLPVLMRPAMTSAASDPAPQQEALQIAARARRAWGRFRQAAVSSFAFVEAAGPLYAGKLIQDSLGLGHAHTKHEAVPVIHGLTLEQRVATAKTVLAAMSLSAGFGRVVMLAGHGANVANNPHASALHCGACGGQTGEVSARALADLLNTPEVRTGLVAEGVVIPNETVFIAALHDTTTDAVTLFVDDIPAAAQDPEIAKLAASLKAAGALARAERALRLPRAAGGDTVAVRARDWAETRPEWGLAGCSAFIAAPRPRTQDLNLGARAFLHSYDWRADKGFGVLELILTAPVVVVSWISLQYYGSVVAPAAFGGGNKLLHNVVGGFGVLEGNGGAPRVGLPWQSVHDGRALQHDPLRLTVLIEAPVAQITAVLERHGGLRDLFDNRWLHLLALDDTGRVAERYVGGLKWEPFDATVPAAKAA